MRGGYVYTAGAAPGFVDRFTGTGILNALLTRRLARIAAARLDSQHRHVRAGRARLAEPALYGAYSYGGLARTEVVNLQMRNVDLSIAPGVVLQSGHFSDAFFGRIRSTLPGFHGPSRTFTETRKAGHRKAGPSFASGPER
jgi:hypothetical protein